MILPKAKGKLRKQRKLEDVSKYNSHHTSKKKCFFGFFLPGSVEMKMSFLHVSAFILKPMSQEISEVTLECQFICSTCVH